MEDLKILVVEDESIVALEITQTIKSFGYREVYSASNINLAKKLLKENSFDLILMDINLGEKEIDGIELYQSLDIKTPIIYITAYKDESTIQRAIVTNPIGYLIKPHNDSELKALLLLSKYKMSLNKNSNINNDKIALGEGYYFDKKERKLFFNELYIHLGKKELQLLELLVSAKGNIVSYYTIEHEIWGSQSVSDSTIRTLIYRLRGKLEHKLINSQPNYGVNIPSLKDKEYLKE